MEQERQKTAFVSGSTGFLGRNLIEQLTASGWAVTALLADREFVGQKWLAYLRGRGIRFRIRVKDSTRLPNLNGVHLNAWRYFGDLAVGESRIRPRPRHVWGCSV